MSNRLSCRGHLKKGALTLKLRLVLNVRHPTVIYCRYNNKTYRIDDIEWEKRPSHTFELHNQNVKTFKDYYKEVTRIVDKSESQ